MVIFQHSFPSSRHSDVVLNHTESGYTTGPCNNALLNSTATTEVANGDISKNSNLLVNVPAKDDLAEKKSMITGNGVGTTVVSGTGTIGRTGTLCKKVYL